MSALELESFEAEPMERDPCEVCCELEEQDATTVVTVTWVVIGTLMLARLSCCDACAKKLRAALHEALREQDEEVAR